MSPNYEGVRVFWNGSGKLFFESGESLKVPREFLEKLPSNISLDGVLW